MDSISTLVIEKKESTINETKNINKTMNIDKTPFTTRPLADIH